MLIQFLYCQFFSRNLRDRRASRSRSFQFSGVENVRRASNGLRTRFHQNNPLTHILSKSWDIRVRAILSVICNRVDVVPYAFRKFFVAPRPNRENIRTMGKKNSKLKQDTIDRLTTATYCKFPVSQICFFFFIFKKQRNDSNVKNRNAVFSRRPRISEMFGKAERALFAKICITKPRFSFFFVCDNCELLLTLKWGTVKHKDFIFEF